MVHRPSILLSSLSCFILKLSSLVHDRSGFTIDVLPLHVTHVLAFNSYEGVLLFDKTDLRDHPLVTIAVGQADPVGPSHDKSRMLRFCNISQYAPFRYT
jgi:hypothetical protein